jgi:hypothetical protein
VARAGASLTMYFSNNKKRNSSVREKSVVYSVTKHIPLQIIHTSITAH